MANVMILKEKKRTQPASARGRKKQPAAGKKISSAKWIKSIQEHEDHSGQSLATKNHDVIKRWAKERKAAPATVPGTEHDGRPGVLRFDFPGYGGRELEEISWDYWFKSFDQRDLVFQFQEHLKNGKPSNFFKLNNPDREEE